MKVRLLWILWLVPALARPEAARFSIGWEDAAVTGTALVTALTPYLLADRIIRPRCPCPIDELSDLDRWAVGKRSHAAVVTSDLILGAAVAFPVLARAAPRGMDGAFLEDMVVYGEALAVSAALVSVMKVAVQRPLPRTYEGDPAMVASSEGYRSFYSGHVTITTTALVAWARIRELSGGESSAWPWLLAAGASAGVGIARIEAGNHFPTDVVMGAVVGTAVGYVVPTLHRRREGKTSARPAFWVAPLGSGGAVLLSWRL